MASKKKANDSDVQPAKAGPQTQPAQTDDRSRIDMNDPVKSEKEAVSDNLKAVG